jgi:hypothetical protein
MILLISLILASANAEDKYFLPLRPETPAPVIGECKKVFAIDEGRPLPELFRISPSSSPCSGLVVPLSDYADLLNTEKWAEAISAQHSLDISVLQMEVDWYKTRLELEIQPLPWLERPSTQRWLGRIETIVIVGVVTAGLGTTYYYSSGVGR